MTRPTKVSASLAARAFTLLAILSLTFSGCARFSAQKARKPQVLDDARVVQVKEDEATQKRIEAFSRFAAGVHYDLTEKPQAATDEYLQAALADSKNEDLVIDVSGRLIRDGKSEDAIALLNKAAAEPKSEGRIYALLGLAYLQSGRTNEAVQANREAIKRSPDNLAAYQNLAGLQKPVLDS